MSTTQNKTVLDELKALMEKPDFQERLAKQIAARKPDHASNSSVFSYYREQFALEIKIILDELIEQRREKVLLYADYKCKPKTLYLRIQQGFKYLRDKMDVDNRYSKLATEIIIEQERGYGICFRFIANKTQGKPLIARDLASTETRFEYKEEITKFLEDDSIKVYDKQVAISEDEVHDIKMSLAGLEGIAAFVSRTRIKIVKGL